MLTLVPAPRKRLVPALSSMGRKPEVQHHATRLVVDDYGDAVAVQKRCSSCMRWHSTYERGWCLDCKVFSERARRHRLDEDARAAWRDRRRLAHMGRAGVHVAGVFGDGEVECFVHPAFVELEARLRGAL